MSPAAKKSKYRHSLDPALKELLLLNADYAYGMKIDIHGLPMNDWSLGSLLNITGLTNNQLKELGGYHKMIYHKDLGKLHEHIDKAISGKKSEIILRIRSSSGELKFIEDKCQPVKDKASGEIKYIRGTVRNIDTLVREEKRIVSINEDLRYLNELSGKLQEANTVEGLSKILNKELGNYYNCKSTGIYLYDEKTDTLMAKNLFLNPDIIKLISKVLGGSVPTLKIRMGNSHFYKKCIRENILVEISKKEDIYRLAEEFTAPLAQKKMISTIVNLIKINSILLLPLVSKGSQTGVLEMAFFDNLKQQRISNLKQLGQGLANIITKRINEIHLEEIEKQKDEAVDRLLENEFNLNLISNSIAESVSVIDKNGVFLYSNKTANNNLAGDPDKSLVNRSIKEFTNDAEKLINEYRAVIKTGKPFDRVVPVTLKTGKKWFKNQLQHIKYGKSKTDAVLSTSLDITEIKNAENKIKEEEYKYRTLLDNSGVGIGYYDTNGRIIFYNKNAALNIGMKPEQLQGKTNYDLFPKAQADEYTYRLNKALQSPRLRVYEDSVKLPGGVKWFKSTHKRISDSEGNIQGVQIVSTDITSIKKSEEAISKSEKKYRTVFNKMAQGAFFQNADGYVPEMNRAGLKLLGLKKSELSYKTSRHPDWHIIDENHNFLPGDKHPSMIALSTGKIVRNRIVGIYKHEKNEYTWLSVNAHPEFNKGEEKPYRVFVTLHDVTKLKNAQEELISIDKQLRTERDRANQYLDIAASIIVVLDKDGIITLLNNEGAKHLECTVKEAIGLNWFDEFLPGNNKDYIKKVHTSIIEGEEKQFQFVDSDIITRKGKRKVIRWHNSTIKDENGKITSTLSSGEDITSQLEAEQALRESEQQYKDLVEKAGIAISIDDADGNMIYFNSLFASLFGYKYHEMKAMSHADFVHPDDLKWVQENHRRKMQNKRARAYYEFKGLKKDGSVIWVEVRSTVLKEGDRPIGTRSYLADITTEKNNLDKLKESERKLQKSYNQVKILSKYIESAREAERKNIARELHDELGQTLTALKMDLSWIRKRENTDSAIIQERMGSMQQLIDHGIKSVQRISSELRPSMLDNLGLIPALEWYSNDFSARSGLNINFDYPEKPLNLPDNVSVAIYRIVQEAFTNTYRHAKAKNINLRIIKNKKTIIQIEDDGIGIPQEKLSSPYSYGITGMIERVGFLNGNIDIRTGEEKGTVINVELDY